MQTATTTNGTHPMVFDTRMAIHRRVAPAIQLLLALMLAACIPPSSQSVSQTSASPPVGTTLHMSLKDEFSALIGGELLGAAEAGYDQLVGDLAETWDGKWRGVVTASADRTIRTFILGTNCDTALTGTQQGEVVATRGTYAEGRNLRLVLTPKSAPNYTTYPSCDQPPVKVKAPNGIEWLWFYFEDYRGSNLDVHLPDKPGGTWKWEFAPGEPDFLDEPPSRGGCEAEFLQCSHTTTLTVEYR